MTETPTPPARPRRRASRRAGPPVDDQRPTPPPAAATTTATGRTPAAKTPAPEPCTATEPVAATETAARTGSAAAVEARAAAETSAASKTLAPTDAKPIDAEASLWSPDRTPEVAGESDAGAAESEGAAEDGKRGLGPLGWAAAVVAVLSIMGLIGSGGFAFYHHRQVEQVQARRAEYVQTARQAVLDLTTINDNTAGQDIDRVLSVLSGDLKKDLTQNRDAYQKVVQQIKIKATGQVTEAAIESDDANSARVLVVAKQTLTNAGTNDGPQERNYRFRVTLTRGDKGVTASDVEFVA